MKGETGLRNNLKQTRIRMGLSQQDLANLAGVTRQNIGSVEAGLYAPSATVALRLAKALGCRVDELFWLEEDLPEIEATPVAGMPADTPVRLALARVGGRWVAHPLSGDDAFRTELIPADGVGVKGESAVNIRVRPLYDSATLVNAAVLAGCSPALSLWARATERWHPGLRVHWIFANSMAALGSLSRGEVHAAGMHLYDPESGEHNVPFVRRAMPGRAAVLINLGIWAEGFVVGAGNPLGIRTGADLAQPGVRIVNREEGAGSRQMLERELHSAHVPCAAVSGYDRLVTGHIEVAREVAAGRADAGVTTAAVAAAFGLGFVPLSEVRYDMVVLKEYLTEPPIAALFSTLSHRWVRSQLEALGGYDTALTGEVVATIEA